MLATASAPAAVQPDDGRVRTAPIGVFDSGIGGLSVVRALRTHLPAEDVLYFADSLYCPYGSRDERFILERSVAIADHLVRAGIKLLVTACNTACAVALEHLRTRFDLEIVGLEPAVKPAVLLTRSGRVAVFATPRTIASPRLAGLIDRHGRGVEIELLAAPGWVELVEDGISDPERASTLIEPLVEPVVDRGADVLVLGCTHYPFLEPLIRAAAGAHVEIVDSGAAIARRACELLDRHELSMPASASTGTVSLMTTSPNARSVGILATRLLGTPVAASSVIV